MVDPNSSKFIASLVKSLQMFCHGYMDFDNNIEIIGHINVRIDNSHKFDYIVNEQVCKQGGESTFFQSNSYHSLPPGKGGPGGGGGGGGGGERDAGGGRFKEEEVTVNNHHRLGDEAGGGGRVQVDLSGPVPVTRSTSAPTPDGYFSTTNSSRRRSHSRDSRLHSLEEEQGALAQQHAHHDHTFNHSKEGGDPTGNGAADHRAELLTLYKESERSRQLSASLRHDVIVKNEPKDRLDAAMDESGSGDGEALDASSTSSMLPAAHQAALAAHSGHAMLATSTLGHPAFFDSGLTQQDVAEVHPAESSYRTGGMGEERESGEDLSKQTAQNGQAMSLVTRSRTPPDLGYPTGPTQLPQTADFSGKESVAPLAEKNRCDHCSKNFRNAQLLEMHIALIHTHRNYMSPKSMRTNSSYLTGSSPQGAGGRRASQSPGHHGGGGGNSRSKSQSPIMSLSQSQLGMSQSPVMSQQQSHVQQPLALTHSMLPTNPSSPSTLGMSLPNMPNTMASHPMASSAQHSSAAAMAAAAMAQSYSMEASQVGPMMGGGGSAFQCHLCHMPFVSWGLLAAHQNHCPRRGPHRCEQCGKAFRSKTSLTDHINTIHKGILFICKGCRETFKWRTHIYQHKRKCPHLQNVTFESGSFFIEEMAQRPPLDAPLSVPPALPLPAESMEEAGRVN